MSGGEHLNLNLVNSGVAVGEKLMKTDEPRAVEMKGFDVWLPLFWDFED